MIGQGKGALVERVLHAYHPGNTSKKVFEFICLHKNMYALDLYVRNVAKGMQNNDLLCGRHQEEKLLLVS